MSILGVGALAREFGEERWRGGEVELWWVLAGVVGEAGCEVVLVVLCAVGCMRALRDEVRDG